MKLRLRPRIRPQLTRRRPRPETRESSTILIVLYNGKEPVYRLETPAEISEDEYGVFVAIGQHMSTLDEPITFDRIEVQPRYRRHGV